MNASRLTPNSQVPHRGTQTNELLLRETLTATTTTSATATVIITVTWQSSEAEGKQKHQSGIPITKRMRS